MIPRNNFSIGFVYVNPDDLGQPQDKKNLPWASSSAITLHLDLVDFQSVSRVYTVKTNTYILYVRVFKEFSNAYDCDNCKIG